MKHALLIMLCLGASLAHGQGHSVLASGKWHKFSVQFDAVHKLDYNLLRNAGINPDQIDPKKIQLYAGSNGMLPQANNQPRMNDLTELAIFISGEGDGKFNSNDYILFYGQGPDVHRITPSKTTFYYENNLFTDKNFYFLTVGSADGKRMTISGSLPGSFPAVTEFDDFTYYETERQNELHSGRDWFGEQFDTRLEYTVRFDLPGIVPDSPIKLISNVMGESFGASSFQLFFNDVAIGQQQVPPIVDSPYATKGNEVTDTLLLNAGTVNAAGKTNQDVRIRFTKAASGRSVGYLDYLLLQTKRNLSLYGDQTFFYSLKSLQQPVSQFMVSNSPVGSLVWDVSDPFGASVQTSSIQSGVLSFSVPSTELKKYVVLSNKNFPVPASEGAVENQDLHGLSFPQFLIVTAPEFRTEAQRLAAHRQSKNGIISHVVTTTEIYNEFSGGKQDVTAIRDAIRYMYNNGNGLRNVLLFGRGSYDYKDYLPFNKNFVPAYESRNSLSPLETYASDDYFAFMEPHEGTWKESPAEPSTLDIGVGRCPVKKIEEAKNWVDKMLEFESKNWGDWRKEILFVGDDGDFSIHQDQANQLAETLETDNPEFNTTKLFVDDFKQVLGPAGQVSPEARTALTRAVGEGIAIVNFTGHGSESQWLQERIFDQLALDDWKPARHYPLLVTATCEFGRTDDPGLISTSELSLIRKGGGCIGLLTTSRPVNSSTNFTLNKAFYQALMTKDQGSFRDLGTIFRETKNNSMSGVANRNFSLLADPSMKLPLPSSEVRITELTNLLSGYDTLKALSKVRVRGSVYTNGIPDASYNGTLVAVLFDKRTSHTTKGDENAPFNYQQWDNGIFRGQASIRNGFFEMEFTVPKSIDLTVGPGKFALYAYPSTSGQDVTGVKTPIKIGSMEKNPGADTTGPEIELYMGDSTFVDGGIVGTSSHIVAILEDENGIDISDFNSATDITANLDDTLTVRINKYYQSDVDNFKRGKVIYLMEKIKPGSHRLTLSATDTFGNTSTTSITFFVSEENGIQLEQLLNYPNPVSTGTVVHFKHNRSGEDIEAVVTVFNQVGQPVMSRSYLVTNSAYQVDLPEWDATAFNGTKLSDGLYLLKLSLRSLSDGSKIEKITKVIISN